MFKYVVRELKNHAPFTIFGAFTGIIIMIICRIIPFHVSYNVFYILHPAHIVISALVTASMYELHVRRKCKLWILVLIGYLGSVGIATLSDSVIPFIGEILLQMPKREIHIGFIEKWWLINPLAVTGVVIAYFRPATKFPHAGHVLLSTWASLFHIYMALDRVLNWISYATIFIFLFLAVWIPCCISDIVFPLLFTKKTGK